MLALYELNSQPSPIRLVVVLCALPVWTVLWLFVFLYCQRSIFTEQFAARCHIGLYTPVVLQPADNSSVHRVLQTRCCWLTDTTMLFLFYMFSEPCGIFFSVMTDWSTARLAAPLDVISRAAPYKLQCSVSSSIHCRMLTFMSFHRWWYCCNFRTQCQLLLLGFFLTYIVASGSDDHAVYRLLNITWLAVTSEACRCREGSSRWSSGT